MFEWESAGTGPGIDTGIGNGAGIVRDGNPPVLPPAPTVSNPPVLPPVSTVSTMGPCGVGGYVPGDREIEDWPPAGYDPRRSLDVLELRLRALIRGWWLVELPAWVDPGWWAVPLRADVARLLDLPVGPKLLAAVDALPDLMPCRGPHVGDVEDGGDVVGVTGVEPARGSLPGVPCACQLVAAAALDAVESWLQARSARLVVTLAGEEPTRIGAGPAGGGPAGEVVDPCREDLAAAWRVSPLSAARRIDTARRVTALEPLVSAASEGLLGWRAVRAVESQVHELGTVEQGEVAAAVVAKARQRRQQGLRPWTASEVRQHARRLVAALATKVDQVERRQRAERCRGVTLCPVSEHLSDLVATLPAADAHLIYRRISGLARHVQQEEQTQGAGAPAGVGSPNSAEDPGRSIDNIRADVLVDLILADDSAAAGSHATRQSKADPGAGPASPSEASQARDSSARRLRDASGPPSRARGGEVNVTVPLATLVRLGDAPGELAGHGPIPADIARELAADRAWRLWVTDPAGRVTAVASRAYTPPAALARLVRARLPSCRFPGCRRPATDCDIDHAIPWPAGATAIDNLGPLCRRHHRLKTNGEWQLEAHLDGSWSWTDPNGFTHRDRPPPAPGSG